MNTQAQTAVAIPAAAQPTPAANVAAVNAIATAQPAPGEACPQDLTTIDQMVFAIDQAAANEPQTVHRHVGDLEDEEQAVPFGGLGSSPCRRLRKWLLDVMVGLVAMDSRCELHLFFSCGILATQRPLPLLAYCPNASNRDIIHTPTTHYQGTHHDFYPPFRSDQQQHHRYARRTSLQHRVHR